MKRVGIWMIGIGLFINVGLIPVKPGHPASPKENTHGQDEHATTCTLNTLKGTYLFAATGYNITTSGDVESRIALVESIDFDGDGRLTSLATISINGQIFQNIVDGGSYTVAENCTSTVTFEASGVHLEIFFAPNAKEVDVIQTDDKTVLAGVARKVSPN